MLGVQAPTPPLKGQIVLLRHDRPLLRRIVEHGKNYLVPREDGRVLIGATEEDAGFDTRTTPAAVRDLLSEALWLCPVLGQAEVEASWAGLRPGSIDTRPYIGPAPGYRNLIVATGHKRAGLQLSPATAELVADLVWAGPLGSTCHPSGSTASRPGGRHVPIVTGPVANLAVVIASIPDRPHQHLGRGGKAQRHASAAQPADDGPGFGAVLQISPVACSSSPHSER